MLDAGVVEIALSGHLTLASLNTELAGVARQLEAAGAEGGRNLLVDALQMRDYDTAARQRFVAFNADHRRVFRRVAILTDNRLWLMVISAMSLASGQTMRGFRIALLRSRGCARRGDAERATPWRRKCSKRRVAWG